MTRDRSRFHRLRHIHRTPMTGAATQQRVRLERAPTIEVRVYPNVIYVIDDGTDVLALTPEQWAEMVETVGISGFAPTSKETR